LGEVWVGKPKRIPSGEIRDLEWANGQDVFLNLDYLMRTHLYCEVSGPYRTSRVLVRSGALQRWYQSMV